MYLFLGQDCVVNSVDIIGIFDLDNASVSKYTKDYLSKAQKSGNVVNAATDIPKSFIVYEKSGERKVYLSHVSPHTLKKRTQYIKEIANL